MIKNWKGVIAINPTYLLVYSIRNQKKLTYIVFKRIYISFNFDFQLIYALKQYIRSYDIKFLIENFYFNYFLHLLLSILKEPSFPIQIISQTLTNRLMFYIYHYSSELMYQHHILFAYRCFDI